MKLLIISISKNKGFMMIEIMLAFSLFALFTISIYALTSSFQKMKIWSLKELFKMEESVSNLDALIREGIFNPASTTITSYGNDSSQVSNDLFSITQSDFINSWGGSTCSPRIVFDPLKLNLYSEGVALGTGNNSTDMEVKNSIAYVTTDSNNQAQPDFFIIDVHNPSSPSIISSLNTGPGLSAVTVAGPYAYVTNTGATSQLQVIDIHDREHPFILSQVKLPFPTATTSAPVASSIFYKRGFIYLGTSKWEGNELTLIDVTNPESPDIYAELETGTLVNDIFATNSLIYAATSDNAQMRVYRLIHGVPYLTSSFSPSGWETQTGRVLDYFEDHLSLGRTVGGFNNTSNHEAFLFEEFSDEEFASKDIPGGVYGILRRPPFVFLATRAPGAEFQVWNTDLTDKSFQKSLSLPSLAKMSCDWSNLYFVTGTSKGFSIMTLK